MWQWQQAVAMTVYDRAYFNLVTPDFGFLFSLFGSLKQSGYIHGPLKGTYFNLLLTVVNSFFWASIMYVVVKCTLELMFKQKKDQLIR